MNGNRESRWLLLIYAATVFVSAFLLFQVQPLISRMILPWFGGTPAVWTTCMLFFQSVLFLGYAYAHAANSKMTPKWQALIHFVLLLGALMLARIEPSAAWKPHDAGAPIGRILLLLAACVGIPYFVLATTGPLLQAWFSRMFAGRSPYRLYALSNVGSLLALLSYPFWFEPRYGLNQQTWLWFGGFALFAALCALVAFQLWRGFSLSPSANKSAEGAVVLVPIDDKETLAGATQAETDPTWYHWVLWLVLPAFGSFMLLATTNHVCQDVAVVPFLWVVPLSVYLLTFIVAFDHPRWYRPLATALVTIIALYAVAAIYYLGFSPFNLAGLGRAGTYLDRIIADLGLVLGLPKLSDAVRREFVIKFVGALAYYFAALFLICMLCHGQLARLRPTTRHLTAYYLMISAGGALGGILVSLVAPLVFTTFLEWKLGIFASYILAMLVAMVAWPQSTSTAPQNEATGQGMELRTIVMIVLRIGVLAVMLGGLFEVVTFLGMGGATSLEAVRNFYGTVSIREFDKKDPQLHGYAMFNGRIIHGFQFTDPKKRPEPTTYYTHHSGVGRTLDSLHARAAELRVGAVGLGIGTLAAYASPGSKFCFYEINPVAERFAKDQRYFSFMSDHADRVNVELGDARLSLERQKPQHLHLLVLDAFSGDAIPTHLLTREAFEIYRGHMATREADGIDGSIAIHVTNKYFDLRPVVLAGAAQLGMECLTIETNKEEETAAYHSKWMILTRDKDLADALRPYVHDDDPPPKEPLVWTDDHSDPFKLLTR